MTGFFYFQIFPPDKIKAYKKLLIISLKVSGTNSTKKIILGVIS